MAYKKDIKPLLKYLGLTWEEMDALFEDLCETNKKCRMIKESGKSWSDLSIPVIRQIPTQKERDLEEAKRLEEEEKAEALRKKQEEEAEAYYRDYFDVIMVKKIDDGDILSEQELKTLVHEYGIKTKYGEESRWSRYVNTICELCNRTFSIVWYQGLTELQEDSYDSQPTEVYRHTKVKVSKFTTYLDTKSPDVVSDLSIEKAKVMFDDLISNRTLPSINETGLTSDSTSIVISLGVQEDLD